MHKGADTRAGGVDPATAAEVAEFLGFAWTHTDVAAKSIPVGTTPASRIFFDVMGASRDHWALESRAKLTDKEEAIGTIASDALGGLVGLLGGPAAAVVASAIASISWVATGPDEDTSTNDCSQCHTNPH